MFSSLNIKCHLNFFYYSYTEIIINKGTHQGTYFKQERPTKVQVYCMNEAIGIINRESIRRKEVQI